MVYGVTKLFPVFINRIKLLVFKQNIFTLNFKKMEKNLKNSHKKVGHQIHSLFKLYATS